MNEQNITSKIREKALEYLTEHQEGIKFSNLINLISTSNSNFNRNTINGAI